VDLGVIDKEERLQLPWDPTALLWDATKQNLHLCLLLIHFFPQTESHFQTA